MQVPIRRVVEWLMRPEKAVSNARAAATEASRRLVEHEEVRHYLDERRRRGVTKSA